MSWVQLGGSSGLSSTSLCVSGQLMASQATLLLTIGRLLSRIVGETGPCISHPPLG